MSVGDDAAKKARQITRERINKVMRAVSIELVGRIMERTPVDTGRARANWNCTTGSPDTSTDNSATDYETKQGENQKTAGQTDFAAGEKLFIANGLPYIEVLEAGSSKQAPNGMVALSVAELQPVVEDLARQINKNSL